MNRKNRIIRAACIAALIVSGSCLFAQTKPDSQLKPVEIREYQGKKLSASSEFRENSIEGPQKIDIKNYRLTVSGLVKKPALYTYGEVLKFRDQKKVVILNCVEGWSVRILWQGIPVKDILEKSGIDPRAVTVVFYAQDGYTTSLPLDFVLKNNIMMAYSMNGQTLTPEHGYPFQLVAEDKWGYKWIKWITRIELSNDPKYKGYWEKRGFSQEGDLGKSFNE